MKENLRRFLGLRWSSPHQQLAFRFENRRLRLAAYLSFLGIPALWSISELELIPVSIEIAFLVPRLSLLCVTAYYGHLVIRRFRVSLPAVAVLVILGGLSTAIIWVSAGWEAGLTMFLVAGALLGYAIAWGQSVVRFCNLRGKPAHVGLVVLGALTPPAFFAMLFGLWLMETYRFFPGPGYGWLLIRGVLSSLCGLLILIPAFWLTRRCRLAAREVLAADSTTADAPDDVPPTEMKWPLASQRAHAAWIIQHKRRWPLVLVVIFCGGFVPYICLVARGMSLARRIEPISWQALLELAPKPVPDAENAAVLWRDAKTAMTIKAATVADQDWRDEATYAAGSLARTLLSSSAKVYSLADQAADRERCNWELKYEELFHMRVKHLAPMRELARHLAARIHVAAYDGDWATVHRSLRTMCAGADHVASDPILIPYLVATAIEALASGTIETILSVPGSAPTERDIRQLEELARERLRPPYQMSDALRGESKIGLATIDAVASGRIPNLLSAGYLSDVLNWYAIFHAGDREAYKTGIDAIIAEVEAATAGRQLRLTKSSRELFPVLTHPSLPHLATSLLHAFDRMPEIVARRNVTWRLALLGLAAKRHALAHGGAWPAALVVLGFQAPELLDPFDPDGKPIRYRINKDGTALLWSVGRNREDDDGEVKWPTKDDIVFRLYAPVPKGK